MKRRELLKTGALLSLSSVLKANSLPASTFDKTKGYSNDREYWIDVMTRIANPVLVALSNEKLKEKMPVEYKKGHRTDRRKVAHLEAFGRLMAGIAPWLELGIDNTDEGKLREKYLDLSLKSLSVAVNPKSPDFMNFTEEKQPLVDSAYVAHALLRAPNQLWQSLTSETKMNIIKALKSTRTIKPHPNNWLLFSAIIEACLLKFDKSWEKDRVDFALKNHFEWYKGDGIYGDGKEFHWDYYNSYVIHPMMLDVLKVMIEEGVGNVKDYEKELKRAQRYAVILERLISPEGTFPPIGRSLPYRFGAFQALSQMVLMKKLPKELNPGQVRNALTTVIKKVIEIPGTFDENGWLKIGFYGYQPNIAEAYISTGSIYLCSLVFLPLGLKPDDEFWASPPMDWTSKKIWNGENLPNDQALVEK